MSKITDILRKLDNKYLIMKMALKRADILEKENVLLRMEVMKMQCRQNELVRYLAEKLFPKTDKKVKL